jgi:hypothetical protein
LNKKINVDHKAYIGVCKFKEKYISISIDFFRLPMAMFGGTMSKILNCIIHYPWQKDLAPKGFMLVWKPNQKVFKTCHPSFYEGR